MKKMVVFILAVLSVAAWSQTIHTITKPKYDYYYTTNGDPFALYAKGEPVIQVNGVDVCEWDAGGTKFRYRAADFGYEFGEVCPDLGFAALTKWEPYTKKGKSAKWLCTYGTGYAGYSFRFVKGDCPDVITAFGRGAWLEELRLGKDFTEEDFPWLPQVEAYYNLNTLENNPKFAERVKYRADRSLISRAGDP